MTVAQNNQAVRELAAQPSKNVLGRDVFQITEKTFGPSAKGDGIVMTSMKKSGWQVF